MKLLRLESDALHWRWLGSAVLALTLLSACGKGANELTVSKAEEAKLAASAVPSTTGHAAVGSSQAARSVEIDMRFKQAAAMLHIKQYQYAATALHRVLQLAPNMPEAHVNMGYAMLGMGRHVAARDFFNEAIKLKPSQANAYYGLALASYNTGEMTTAIDALNSYIQLSNPDDPYLNQARAALSAWRQASPLQLGMQSEKRKSDSHSVRKQSIGDIKEAQ